MLLARKTHTLGSIVQWQVDYGERPCWDTYVIPSKVPLREGDSITTATVTSDKPDVTVGTVTVFEGHKVTFLLSNGSLNELFTLTVVINTTNSEKFEDTVQFSVVAP
jgi:hypothetical protein